MRTKIIAGNWKMNGSLSSIKQLISGINDGMDKILKAEVVVCPPSIYLPKTSGLISDTRIILGAQDVSDADSGAYTGEISTPMLKEFSCSFVIVGHSERRNNRGESDLLVANKFQAAQKGGLIPILCVGELLSEREEGITEEVIARQVDAVINLCGIKALANSVIAYEPVWAIGTGKTATPEQAQAVHSFIRNRIAQLDKQIAANLRIQYGGSMNSTNASELLAMEDIDGGLIGGASLKAQDFLAICNAAESQS